jgi:hypothetical protein
MTNGKTTHPEPVELLELFQQISPPGSQVFYNMAKKAQSSFSVWSLRYFWTKTMAMYRMGYFDSSVTATLARTDPGSVSVADMKSAVLTESFDHWPKT